MNVRSALGRARRSATAVASAHQLGDIIDAFVAAQEAYAALSTDAKSSAADKISLEVGRLLDQLERVSPVRVSKNAQALLGLLRSAHTAVRYFYEHDGGVSPEAKELAAASDRLVVKVAGLNPDSVSVRDFVLD